MQTVRKFFSFAICGLGGLVYISSLLKSNLYHKASVMGYPVTFGFDLGFQYHEDDSLLTGLQSDY